MTAPNPPQPAPAPPVNWTADEVQKWQEEQAAAQHSVLTDVRATAAKWQAAIAAVLGTFVTVGFVWGPDKLDKFPLKGADRDTVLTMLAVAGVLGLGATVFASVASIGYPARKKLSPSEYGDKIIKRANTALTFLKVAMVAAGIAAVLVVYATGWVLKAASNKPVAPTSAHALVTIAGVSKCGEVKVNDKGSLGLVPAVAEAPTIIDPRTPTTIASTVPLGANDRIIAVVDDCPG